VYFLRKTRKVYTPLMNSINERHIDKSRLIEITGLGAVTPFGIGVEPFWQAVTTGKNGFVPISLFSTEGHRTGVAAEVRELPSPSLRRVKGEVLSRADRLALTAALEALKHAGLLDLSKGCVLSPDRTGVVVGTAAGAILGLESFFRKRALKQTVDFPQSILSSFCLSAIATNIAREFVIEGPRMTIATVCSSSGLALAAAKELLESEDLDHVLVVGTETISEVVLAGFNSLRSVAPERCQPFDLNRKGIILGEGAGAMVLERAGVARRRKVPSLTCLKGYGLTTDLHHFTAPQPEGQAIAQTIRQAMADAAVEPGEVDYVNAHGTGTRLNDAAESRGIKIALESSAEGIPISSIKSMIGHQMGAASILEAITTVLSLNRGVIPPTANLETPDPECDLDYTSEGARRYEPECAISNSFAFGGSNISLVFGGDSGGDGVTTRPVPDSFPVPVITGIGLVTPVGIGKNGFIQSVREGSSGLVSLAEMGDEWASFRGGLVDMSVVREKIPVSLRRHLNRQASFLFLSFNEAMEDAGLSPFECEKMAMTYGSAFGCSGNVHRFYSQLLTDGPKYASPMDFNMSVTNAPPALVAQAVGFKGPIWVFVADEASWELSLHWAVKLIREGKADQVVVSAAEEVSESILAIHHELGLLEMKERKGLILGEGAVSMVIESHRMALTRGARVYGTLTSCNTAQDSLCGPLDYSSCGEPLLRAAFQSLQGIKDKKGNLLCVSPENGNKTLEAVTSDTFKGLNDFWHQDVTKACFRSYFGESGASGGLGLAAALLNQNSASGSYVLVLTSARGGINAASLVQLVPRLMNSAY
jgi:3-oxoacyl-[acyl-carrier-protein] synthase II